MPCIQYKISLHMSTSKTTQSVFLENMFLICLYVYRSYCQSNKQINMSMFNLQISADPSGWQGERAGEELANDPGPSFRAPLFCCGEEAVSELCCFGLYSAAILG